MKRLWWLMLVVVLVAAVAMSVVYGQGGGRGGPGAAGEDRTAAMMARLGLNEKEQAAVAATMLAKSAARQALQEELGKLREAAYDEKAKDEQLTQAVDRYTKAVAKYREKVQSEDRSLTGKLSAKGRARCLAEGVLDNGLGGGGRRSGGGEGRGAGPARPPR